jgi:hypothetical protein
MKKDYVKNGPQYRSLDSSRLATPSPHPFEDKAWCVYYVFPSGREAMKGPFPSKQSAVSWAKGYVSDPANA